GPHRVARLRRDRPPHEVAPVRLGIVVRQVRVQVVGEAVGDEEVERLVAVRRAGAGRPGEGGGIDGERQGGEERRRAGRGGRGRAGGEAVAEERRGGGELAGGARGEDREEATGEDLVRPREAEPAAGEDEEDEGAQGRELRRRAGQREAPRAGALGGAGDAV